MSWTSSTSGDTGSRPPDCGLERLRNGSSTYQIRKLDLPPFICPNHKDSGSPVFAKTGTSSAVLYGLLWSGGDGDGDGTNDWYLYSRFNLVRMETRRRAGS